jgi:hypothetical protein
MSGVRISQEQQDRIVMAAIGALGCCDEDARAMRRAMLGAAEDPGDLQSLLGIFELMHRAVLAELKVMNFEASGQSAPTSSQH